VGRRLDLARSSLYLVVVSWLVELPVVDHPVDHPDDPTGPIWIRLDRRGTQPEQARSVWSRPDRRRAPGYGSGDRAPRWVRPSGLRSAVLVLGRPTVGMVMGAVLVDGSAASCTAGLLPQCLHDPAAVAGSTSPGGPNDRCPQAAPAVGVSGPSVSAGRAGLSWLQRRRAGTDARPPTPLLER
jgi:hypothetical protein